MKKVFVVVSVVMAMTVLSVTHAYAMGGRGYARGYAPMAYMAQGATNLDYTTTNDYPPIDVESFVSARKAYLDSLVSQGVVTQEYADIVLDNYSAMLQFRAANGGFGGGLGGCGGYGGYYNR